MEIFSVKTLKYKFRWLQFQTENENFGRAVENDLKGRQKFVILLKLTNPLDFWLLMA
jgi:hypothetical protein